MPTLLQPPSFSGQAYVILFFFTSHPGIRPVDIVVVIAGAMEVLPMVEMDLKKIMTSALEQLNVIEADMGDGNARNVLCHVVERHAAEILVWAAMDMELSNSTFDCLCFYVRL
ncbi:hypothetical protein KI387_030853 [Taxus chinensis]|uniref:Uncharacterized protein n=1 Tax=Taxus chinensis TaxID=29808 RepID=A0AA38FFE9_TAXCH|nr:hypothetical protein KI387_030853 [Taxus chinensis]